MPDRSATDHVRDALGRPLASLRLSVTDRCNLRCSYCMPEHDYAWLPKAALCDFEELRRLVGCFARLGVRRVRITGGEPLLRRDLSELIAMLRADARIAELALTTNGVLLAAQARSLKRAGLDRVTVSLDTLRRDRFERLTRRDALGDVLAGIDAARDADLGPGLKIDAVVMRGVNDDELGALIDHGRAVGAEVRFIEYMDVGGATRWTPDRVMERGAMLAAIASTHGAATAVGGRGSAPAERFVLGDGTVFGIIASTTDPFCGACDRSRVTADGTWYHCLYATRGTDLKAPMRAGASDDALAALMRRGWGGRNDRGAEERAALADRRGFVSLDALRHDPHLEMHTRGG